MEIPILELKKANNISEFISYWSSIYSYPLEGKYRSHITKENFDCDDIRELFEWKNGMVLSGKKSDSLEIKILSKKETIRYFKKNNDFDIKEFKNEFHNVSAVWKIFLLHILNPKRFPIYDQHVHRAYNFLNGLAFKNISFTAISNLKKEVFYFEDYLPFIQKLSYRDLKKIDEAFFSFGQFINPKRNKYYQLLTNKKEFL